MATKFREAEEIKISMTSSTYHRNRYLASFEVCFWHSSKKLEGKKEEERKKCEKREVEERREVDIERSSPGRAKTRRRSGKGHRNIVSEWNRRRGEMEEDPGPMGSGGRGRPSSRGKGPARRIASRPVAHARQKTAQRLKARGIILL